MPIYVTFPLGLNLLIPMCGTTMYMETDLPPLLCILVSCSIYYISVMVEAKGTPHHGNVGNE